MIVELDAIRAEDRPRVGGKAVGCASLQALGLPVPRGVVLTAEGFDHVFGVWQPRLHDSTL